MFIKLLFSDPHSFATIAVIVIFSICLHEYFHAFAALKMGDPTAAERGHLTLSPLKQMGWWSLVTFLFLGIAWGQIPVNPHNLDSRAKRITVALSGVAANFILIFFFSTVGIISLNGGYEFAAKMLFYGAMINTALFLINLLPIPGFDGFRIVLEFIHFKPGVDSEKLNAVFFIMLMLMIVCIDHIFALAEFLTTQIINFLYMVLS